MGHLSERLERAMGEVTVEAKRPYVPQSREAQQAAEADLHQEVAEAANAVLRALDALAKVARKAAGKAGQMTGPVGTFAETMTAVEKMRDELAIAQIAIDHTRWAKSLRSV